MLYIDDHTAGPISGQITINRPRLMHRQDGQEHSANGTGSEEACRRARAGRGEGPARQEGGTFRRLPVSLACRRARVVFALDPHACAGIRAA